MQADKQQQASEMQVCSIAENFEDKQARQQPGQSQASQSRQEQTKCFLSLSLFVPCKRQREAGRGRAKQAQAAAHTPAHNMCVGCCNCTHT